MAPRMPILAIGPQGAAAGPYGAGALSAARRRTGSCAESLSAAAWTSASIRSSTDRTISRPPDRSHRMDLDHERAVAHRQAASVAQQALAAHQRPVHFDPRAVRLRFLFNGVPSPTLFGSDVSVGHAPDNEPTFSASRNAARSVKLRRLGWKGRSETRMSSLSRRRPVVIRQGRVDFAVQFGSFAINIGFGRMGRRKLPEKANL